MVRRSLLVMVCAMLLSGSMMTTTGDADERAYGRSWGNAYSNQNWQRFYHYPYVYYPRNYWGQEYYQSGQNMYHRYPPEMRIPVYNKSWHNYYPGARRYHSGHHFILDVF